MIHILSITILSSKSHALYLSYAYDMILNHEILITNTIKAE